MVATTTEKVLMDATMASGARSHSWSFGTYYGIRVQAWVGVGGNGRGLERHSAMLLPRER
jgi:hypothetical protein